MMGVGLVLLYFVLAALAAAIVMQSDRYAVRRSIAVGAEARKLFALVGDPARWAPLGAASIVERRPDELVVLRFDSGGKESLATVALRKEGDKTAIDCVVAGRNTFADKIRNILGGPEKNLGPIIEKTLAELAASV